MAGARNPRRHVFSPVTAAEPRLGRGTEGSIAKPKNFIHIFASSIENEALCLGIWSLSLGFGAWDLGFVLIPCPIFIGGEWRNVSGVANSPVFNPSRAENDRGSRRWAAPTSSMKRSSPLQRRFQPGRNAPRGTRPGCFFRYRQLVEENFDRICQSVNARTWKDAGRGTWQHLSRHREYDTRAAFRRCFSATRWKFWRAGSIAKR